MEHLEYKQQITGGETTAVKPFTLVGVVASGNLEVMLETVPATNECVFIIDTAAKGFEESWQAVIRDFMERWKPAGLRISINDNAASPSVVGLRLDQAYEALTGE
ncbi:MAG: malonate decarboxylase acyl carrier protein [Victivallales bacterium]|nr:malonate decarboxylase acyl carrier protein [Victivallales bacterium]